MSEFEYLSLVQDVLDNGLVKEDRTGVGTKSVFGRQMRFALADGFPLLTTKKLHIKSIVHELIWFLAGDTNIQYLKDNGVSIWDEWADENGNLGPVYGKQWRDFNGVDQMKWLQNEIRVNPNSRRLIVSAWNPRDIPHMALPPCHTMFQFNVRGDRLDCQLYQRSADIGLGVPYNIASYALLTCMMAQTTGKVPGEFIHTIGDAHIYLNHIEPLEEQLSRCPMMFPTLKLNPDVKDILDFKYKDIEILDYNSWPHIKMEIAV